MLHTYASLSHLDTSLLKVSPTEIVIISTYFFQRINISTEEILSNIFITFPAYNRYILCL